MDAPPPLPPPRISPFLLTAILLVFLAVVVRTVVGQGEELVSSSLQRLALAVMGILSAVTALIFSVVAFFDRRRAWPLSIFVAAASVCIGWFLVAELRQPLAGVVEQVQSSTATGVDAAERPIPQEKNGPTAAQIQPSLVAWGEETMVRPYQEHGHHDPAWDDAALKLIRGTALHLAGSPAGPGTEHLREMGAEIQRTACDDPWVLFLVRRLGDEDPDYNETMEKAAAAVAGAGYPPFPIWLSQTEAYRAARRAEPAAAGALAASCVEALSRALSAKPLAAGDYHAWVQVLRAQPATSLLEQNGVEVCRAVDAIPGIQEWFRLYLRGRSEIDLAWAARGSGYANTVNADQWQRFGEHLTAAREALERGVKMQPKEAAVASALITVELGSTGIEEMRRRFDTAVQARFDYMPAYEAFRSGLRPRWFGSEEAVLAFGRNCLATQRFDTEVPWQMMRAVQDVAADQDDADAYYAKNAPWKDLETVLDGYVAHGDPARRNYYLSFKAFLAAKRGMDPLVVQLLRQMNYQVDPEVKAEFNLSVQWLERMTAVTGPTWNLVVSAERVEKEHPEQALENLLAAQKLPGLLPITSEYLAGAIAEQKAIVAMQAVPWRTLTPPEDLAGWKVGAGEWKVVSPTILQAKSGSAGSLLTRLEPIGDTWEVRGQFDLANQGSSRTEAALFCGPPGDQDQHRFSLRFWTRPHGWSGISVARGAGEDAVSKQTDFERATPFLVRLANHRLRVYANDGQWLARQPLPNGVIIDSGALLSLGSTVGGGPIVQFHDLEWRTPPPGK